jgi:RNA polymerase sigma-70 factor (ECF subfamily)
VPEAHQAADAVRRARSGDREAFQELVGPYIQPAYNLAFTLLRQRQDAEDAVQESVLRAWTKLGQLRDRLSLKAWFFQIVVNECKMSRRRRWTSVIKLPQLPTRGSQSEDHLIQTTDLRRALSELSEPERLVLFLYYELDLDLEQVGAILGISAAGAKSRLYRAVRRLRPSVGEVRELS